MFRGQTNREILEELDNYVYGHTQAKKVLINFVNRSRLRYYNKQIKAIPTQHLPKSQKLLLLGMSGTGKSHMVLSLCKDILGVPFLFFDATQLNPTGASGGVHVENMKREIKREAEILHAITPQYYPSTQGVMDQMVVMIDEIDKLGNSFESSGNWNSHVQSNFLTLFDAKDNEYEGVSFIFAGAFDIITQDNKNKLSNVGFTKRQESLSRVDLDQKLIQAGLIPELVGRLTSIVELDKFTVEDYTHILKTRLVPAKMQDMYFYGIDNLNLSDEQLNQFAIDAYKSGQGIRALQRNLDSYFVDAEFYYEDNKYCLEQL